MPGGDRFEREVSMQSFAAIDFETANYSRDSACAVAVVRVVNRRVVRKFHSLIRPPSRDFVFTYLHGISWADVREAPSFAEAYPGLLRILSGVDFVAAHNSSFDRSVLHACCVRAGIEPPDLSFRCTCQLARNTLGIRPAKLDNVCRVLGIELNHHDCRSDAAACAKIVLAAVPRTEAAGRGRR
jgi:DNA polymerase-3 subunit epsilon